MLFMKATQSVTKFKNKAIIKSRADVHGIFVSIDTLFSAFKLEMEAAAVLFG